MFGRKILFLAAWYVAGNVVSSVYSGGKKKAIKNQKPQDVKLMIENFLDTQKSFISDIEQKYLSDESREKFSEKKKQFALASEKYIKQWEKLLNEVSKNEKIIAGKNQAEWLLNWLLKKSKTFIWEMKNEILDKESSSKK